MRRSITLTVALAAAALFAPVAAQAGYVTAGKMNQYVAPYPVARYDQAFTLAPNTTQTFEWRCQWSFGPANPAGAALPML